MRPAAEAPPTVVASVAVGATRHVATLALARRLLRVQRARVLRRAAPRRFLLPTLRRILVLNALGIAVFAVLSVLLLRGSRVAWWIRVVVTALGFLVLLRPPHDALLLLTNSLLPVELALLLTPSARAYVRQPPR